MAKQSDQQSTRCRNKSRDLCRSLTISDGLWRSLTISDDLMGCIRTYGASSFSCATSWSFSESRDPAFQTRAQLDVDLCKCQCCDMLRPTNNSRYSIWNQAECKKILAASLRYQLLRNLLRTASHKNGLQLLHSSLCDLAIVPGAASVSNPKLLMQVAP